MCTLFFQGCLSMSDLSRATLYDMASDLAQNNAGMVFVQVLVPS